eukprot:CAMPEP_0198117256 /NCGR_PEP_ID=MMETSP1442-20131203/17476_1 /TAXON_ID= /ORGANISM="Craspedostauros australis, Strain CCMP3328" /LENGTH=240 /DNA_ID=CAMNT_0043775275 /DNA_START=148 /DNA_END=870 /DNA_ORIENTATION=+
MNTPTPCASRARASSSGRFLNVLVLLLLSATSSAFVTKQQPSHQSLCVDAMHSHQHGGDRRNPSRVANKPSRKLDLVVRQTSSADDFASDEDIQVHINAKADAYDTSSLTVAKTKSDDQSDVRRRRENQWQQFQLSAAAVAKQWGLSDAPTTLRRQLQQRIRRNDLFNPTMVRWTSTEESLAFGYFFAALTMVVAATYASSLLGLFLEAHGTTSLPSSVLLDDFDSAKGRFEALTGGVWY